jgi:hypothetical protein
MKGQIMKDFENFSLENYEQIEKVPNGVLINILGLLLLIILGPSFVFLYYKIWGNFGIVFNYNIPIMIKVFNAIVSISILSGFLILHETIHGIFWSKYTDVKVGVILKSLFRFFYCNKPIRIGHYINGLIIPSIILGIIPLIIGMFFGNMFVYGFGLLFIIAGSDDFYIIYQLRRYDRKCFISDIDKKIGIIIYQLKNDE